MKLKKNGTMIFEKLKDLCERLEKEFDEIPEVRKSRLKELSEYITTKRQNSEAVKIVTICTHNSRRSHFAQFWLALAGDYYGIELETYSGGTERSAFNPRAIAAMQRAGFKIEAVSIKVSNPTYHVLWKEGMEGRRAFSKKYDDVYNPNSRFAALMVCSDADENCPVVMGAAFRLALPYKDPKLSDGTPEERATYDERCLQIGREMLYVLHHVG